jgi:Na+/proline symporter
MFGIHPLDLAVVVGYLVVVLALGHRAARRTSKNQEGYFLADRKLGRVYQFF